MAGVNTVKLSVSTAETEAAEAKAAGLLLGPACLVLRLPVLLALVLLPLVWNRVIEEEEETGFPMLSLKLT